MRTVAAGKNDPYSLEREKESRCTRAILARWEKNTLFEPLGQRRRGRPRRGLATSAGDRLRSGHFSRALPEWLKYALQFDVSAYDVLTKISSKAEKHLNGNAKRLLYELSQKLQELHDWHSESIENLIREFASSRQLKLNLVAQPLRVSLTGTTVSPSIFEVMAVLGRSETLSRLRDLQT